MPLESCDAAFVVGTLEFRVVEIGSGLWLPAEVHGNVRNKIIESLESLNPPAGALMIALPEELFALVSGCVLYLP